MQRNTTPLLLKVALTVGFLALAGAAMIAHRNPATGYETSVYAGTPTAVWFALPVAFGAAVVCALLGRSPWLRGGGILLGGSATTLLAGLPIVRGYHYYGGADALTHLGWTRELVAGELSPFEIIYPGVHSFGVFLTEVVGFDVTHSLMLVVLAFVVLYLAFATLAVRFLTASPIGAAVGALSAFLLLPINHIVTDLNPHPITQASMFFAFVLYLLARYVATRSPEDGWLTGTGPLLALATVAVVLYHPQQSAVVVLVLATVAAVQFVMRRSRDGTYRDHRAVYGQTAVAAGAFLAWMPLHGAITRQMESIVSRMVAFVLGTNDQVGNVVGQQGASLTQIGSGIGEIFAKLFLVSAVFAALTALLFLALFRGRVREPLAAELKYFFAGLAALSVFAALHFVGDLSTLFFRYFAMIMVFATILGALQVVRMTDAERTLSGRPFVVVGLAFVLLFSLSVPALFPSPYIYQPNEHRTEAQLDGYEDSFEYTNDAEIIGVGYGTWRYRHAVQGPTGLNWSSDTVDPVVLRNNLTSHYGEDRYVALTEYDRERETTAYREIQYSDDDLNRLGAYEGVHRVYSNSEVELYEVDSS